MNKIKDHLGNEYKSIAEMCRHYNMPVRTYYRRIQIGWNIYEALTIPIRLSRGYTATDHLGNIYENIEHMCKHYKIDIQTYKYRICCGWSKERALTQPVRMISTAIDHKGTKFISENEMCRHYNITPDTYRSRIKHGWSIEKALTTPVREHIRCCAVDHLGNEYESVSEMCRAYSIDASIYRLRIESGLSIGQALTKPLNPHRIAVTDHLGNKYRSITEMCKYYSINVSVYRIRIARGWTVEEALTKPAREWSRKE